VLLRRRRKEARQQKAIHSEEFDDFCEYVGDEVEEWKGMVLEWEDGTSSQNPYSLPPNQGKHHFSRM
jgi:hypothetical protein